MSRPLLPVLSLSLLAPLLISLGLHAQTSSPALSPVPQTPRVVTQPKLSPMRALPGHLVPWARPETISAEPVDPATPLSLTITLARSPEVQAAFDQLLRDQQTPGSPLFHHWLTPDQVGSLFGPLPSDIAALTAWLNAEGLTIRDIFPSRLFLRVSAPSTTIAKALSLTFANYTVRGELHRAPTAEPRLPSALLPLVSSIQGLDDLPERSFGHGFASPTPLPSRPVPGLPQPRYNSANGAHFISPGDFALLYNLTGTYNSGNKGALQRVAVIGRSRVDPRDLSAFGSYTGSGSTANVLIPPTGVDPALAGGGDQLEATLDVERVLGTAPNASVDLVINSIPGGGLFPAAAFAVQNAPYAAINISFGSCEAEVSAASVNRWDTLFAQAAAQGTAVFVSSGDSGVAGCDSHAGNPIPPPPATQIASPNYICASTYAPCVGGTEFTADLSNPTPFWTSPESSTGVSVLGYMSEGAWNEPTGKSSTGVTTYQPIAGAGGVSKFISKPSWQTGPGVPADGQRDTPDISLSSSIHDGYFGCYILGGGDCSANRFEYFFGTSTAAPSMAAITALLDARLNGLQGNLNPALYRIAANPAFKAFHDITLASSGVGSCDLSTPSPCNNSTPAPASLTGGLAGYPVTPGYDLATGLGSLDVGYLLAALAAPSPVNLSLSAGSGLSAVGADTTITATLGPQLSPAPSGTVTFLQNGAVLGTVSTSSNTAVLHTSTLPVGAYTITASYTGDIFYAPAITTGSSSTTLTVIAPPTLTISPSAPSLTLTAGAAIANSDTLTLTSGNGFSSTVALDCAVVGPAQTSPPSCLLSNASPQLAANGTVTVTASILTTHRSLIPGHASISRRPSHPFAPGLAASGFAAPSLAASNLAVPSLATLAGLLLLPGLRRRGSLPRLLALGPFALFAALGISGCGGSSTTSSTPTPPASGTTAGTYTVRITGSGASILGPLSSQTSFTLVVQ